MIALSEAVRSPICEPTSCLGIQDNFYLSFEPLLFILVLHSRYSPISSFFHSTMQLDFSKSQGLVPTIIQDADTNKVLMLGYMNEEALAKTRNEGRVTFFSRSKQRLWTKGETSGNFLEVVDLKVDCDQDTLLIKVNPVGPVCHTGADTCFEEVNGSELGFLKRLETVIKSRRNAPPESSYTACLFDEGLNKIVQKMGEEAIELIIEAKDDDMSLFKNECADMLYHLLVLLEAKDTSLGEVVEVLAERHKL